MPTSLMNAKRYLKVKFDTSLSYDWFDGPLLWFTESIELYPKRHQRALVQEIISVVDESKSYLYSLLQESDELYMREGKLSVRDAILKDNTFNFIIVEPFNTSSYVHEYYLHGDTVPEEFLPQEGYFLGQPN
jgi:hypothetical protein